MHGETGLLGGDYELSRDQQLSLLRSLEGREVLPIKATQRIHSVG